MVPHPCDPEVVLIKHQQLPSIDACHALRRSLSLKALDAVPESLETVPPKEPAGKNGKSTRNRDTASLCANETVKTAQQLLEAYDYAEAETLLAGLRISSSGQLPWLFKAARIPLFRDDYQKLSLTEQEKAEGKIRDLLARMQAQELPLAEAGRIAAALRHELRTLPPDRAARHERMLRERLDRLRPARSEDSVVASYREALLTGNDEKAIRLRDAVTDKGALAVIDAEIARLFRIDAEPIDVSVCEHLTLDLGPEPSHLVRMGGTERHVLLRENDETLLLLDLVQLTGTRLASPRFKNLQLLDAMAATGEFLFQDRSDHETMWRARLVGTDSRFVARFALYQQLCTEQRCYVKEAFMSGLKAGDYYVNLSYADD